MTHATMSLFDAIHSQRAIRHFSAQPVSDEAVEMILNAAIHAPNGGNLSDIGRRGEFFFRCMEY